MKRRGRASLLTVCILFGVISVLGCGEANSSHKMNDAETEESSGQADGAETEESTGQADDSGIIDRKDNTGYENNRGNRITYEDGYCYYASQTDNYFLYRAKEDGSGAVCLAKVHPGTILADGDVIYFVNLSDHMAIYRMGTDGSDMQKICDNTDNHIQMSEEYIYFLNTYDREADMRELVSESEAEEMAKRDWNWDDYLYRIRKDGSGKELLLTVWKESTENDLWISGADNYTIASANGGKVMNEGYLYCVRARRNEETGQRDEVVMRYDLDGKNEEEICCFESYGNIMVHGDRIYMTPVISNGEKKIGMYNIREKEMQYVSDNYGLADYCIYHGDLYGIKEDKDEKGRLTKLYKLEYGGTQWEEIYHNYAECAVPHGKYYQGNLADLYATEQGIFFRQFVSPREGVKWFLLGAEGTAGKWEQEEGIPVTKQASMLEDAVEGNIKWAFPSTSGYEEYMAEDLTVSVFYEEELYDLSYSIRLPQFKEQIEGYQEINAYFTGIYQKSLKDKEDSFTSLQEENDSWVEDTEADALWDHTDYDYVYVGDQYITVAVYRTSGSFGKRCYYEEPVTFERQTGNVVSLGDCFGMSQEEAVARVTASIYKYMENGDGDGEKILLQDEDILTEMFDPEQFFFFPEGIGIYYEEGAIDCMAAGNYVFIVPFVEGRIS